MSENVDKYTKLLGLHIGFIQEIQHK